MRVKDVMKSDVGFCLAADNLMRVAETMLRRDCGIVPVVDEDKRVVGVLTDRDLCLAIVARNRKASDVKAGDLIKGEAIVCAADDKLEAVLRKLRKNQIKRLAVVGDGGELVGILSVSDILLGVRKDKKLKKKCYVTMKSLAKPRPIVLREIKKEATNEPDNVMKTNTNQTASHLPIDMKTLYILRHAKSSWDNADLSDFERPLNERGLKAAPLMGDVMKANQFAPDLILSSPANRAKQTAALVKESAGIESEIQFDERIYEASLATLLEIVAGQNENAASVLLVGHNPGMEALVKFLSGKLEPMPTAALAVVDLETDKWSEINSASGSLRVLIRPKEIAREM